MKSKNFSQIQDQKPADASRLGAAVNLNQIGIDFASSADEMARKVCFTDGNQGSLPGHEVQEWLEAGAQLLAEGEASGAAASSAAKPAAPRVSAGWAVGPRGREF